MFLRKVFNLKDEKIWSNKKSLRYSFKNIFLWTFIAKYFYKVGIINCRQWNIVSWNINQSFLRTRFFCTAETQFSWNIENQGSIWRGKPLIKLLSKVPIFFCLLTSDEILGGGGGECSFKRQRFIQKTILSSRIFLIIFKEFFFIKVHIFLENKATLWLFYKRFKYLWKLPLSICKTLADAKSSHNKYSKCITRRIFLH